MRGPKLHVNYRKFRIGIFEDEAPTLELFKIGTLLGHTTCNVDYVITLPDR